MPLIIVIALLIIIGLLWKSGKAESLFITLGIKSARAGSWLSSDEGTWVSLPEQLPYRDFVEGDEVVETDDGWMWAGLYLDIVSSDGFSDGDWNTRYEQLNRVLTGLPDRTWVQIITSVDNDSTASTRTLSRLAARAPNPTLATILKARARHIELDARRGIVCTTKTYAFIGRQRETVKQKLPLRAFWSSSAHVDLEREAFENLRAETLNAREYFASAYQSAGGRAYPINSQQIFSLIYERLNPERGEQIPTPLLPPKGPGAALTYRTPVRKLDSEQTIHDGNSRNLHSGQLANMLSDLEDAGVIDVTRSNSERSVGSTPLQPSAARLTWIAGAGLFADSPRDRLCLEPIEVMPDYFIIGRKPVLVISLHQLPTLVFAGLAECLTRHPKMCFPFEVTTSFQIGDRYEWDDKLAKKATRLLINLQRSTRPDQTEQMSVEEIQQLRADVRRGDAKLGEVGLAVVISAPTVQELYRRRDVVLMALRSMEGLEGVVEKHLPMPQLTSTLPCAPHADGRRRACLSRDAVGLMPLTGGSRGPVREDDATMVFERVDGGLFFWNPHTPLFPSGMSLVCGGSGSGKSGLLNYMRTALAGAGYRLMTIDFGGSSARVCAALGGRFLDITDPRKAYKLGLFDIRPKPGEQYQPEELTEEGLPRDRLAAVENLLEQLCLDPRVRTHQGLHPTAAGYLRTAVRRTYGNLVGTTPQLDDFIHTLHLARSEDREVAKELAARLEIYASEGSLGRFLNESPDAEEIPTDCPYIVFDLRAAKDDPRLMLVAALAVNSFIRRLLSINRTIPKYLDVDEFNVVSTNPLICNVINETMRTARKLNMLGTVASQSPGDFAASADNPAASGIRDNCEIFFLMRTSNPEGTSQIFQLKSGAARLLRQLQTQTSEAWRDCVLLWPGGGCAHLRLRFGPLDQRLLLAAGHELSTLPEALKDAMSVSPNSTVPVRLQQALATDGLGTSLARITA